MNVRRLLLLVLVMSLVGCTDSGKGDSPSSGTIDATPPLTLRVESPTHAPSPTTCPKDLTKRVRGNDVAGVENSIVPGHPVVLVLCGPGGRVVITEPREVGGFVDALNNLRRLAPTEVIACPADFGPTYGLFFDYANGAVLLVTADASGCRFASNGRSSAWLTSAMLTKVTDLLQAK